MNDKLSKQLATSRNKINRFKISFQLHHHDFQNIASKTITTKERTSPKFHKNRYIARKELDVRKKKERKKKKKKRRTQRPKISFQNSIKVNISRKELDVRKKKERKKKK